VSILDEVKNELETMGPDAIKAELLKLKEQAEKRKLKQKEYNTSPEAAEKRKSYSKEYREKVMADPAKAEKIVAKRKEYMQKPETKARMKEYRDKRNARNKAILERAKELGITLDGATA
jgi:hypothetical protein